MQSYDAREKCMIKGEEAKKKEGATYNGGLGS
jgi:hypothetical protein